MTFGSSISESLFHNYNEINNEKFEMTMNIVISYNDSQYLVIWNTLQ